MFNIMVVEDDKNTRRLMETVLIQNGYNAIPACDGEEALAVMDKKQIDLILLDVMMDRMSGFEMANHLRAEGDNTPIIFLTARDHHDDQLTGFKSGADDYITKPFSFDTVLARIKAVLKRTHPAPPPSTPHVFSFGTLKVDMDNTHVSIQGKNIELTRREYLILCLLIQHPNYHLTREEIMVQVWPNDTLVNDRSVDVHITRLRTKLGPESWRLINRTGFGYAFVNNDSKIAE